MYVGHAALALVVKGRRPHLSLALLVPAAFGPDWVQWILDVFGQTSPQLSHSLVSVGICSVLAALMYRLVVRGSGADAVLLALLWASHWPADLLTGIKPTWPGGPDVGLNLYEYVAFEVIMECALVAICWLNYRRTVPAGLRRQALLVPAGLIMMQVGFGALQSLRERPLPHAFGIPHLLR